MSLYPCFWQGVRLSPHMAHPIGTCGEGQITGVDLLPDFQRENVVGVFRKQNV
jgi:hypothetical protein